LLSASWFPTGSSPEAVRTNGQIPSAIPKLL
jgi:hypothetical protein